jgi:trans-2,3-dihydro-3-hydroxyanthranilate isomerase
MGLNGEMTQRDPEFGAELEPAEVARLTGLNRWTISTPQLPPQVVSTGTVCDCGAALAGCAGPAQGESRRGYAWLRERGARWFYVLGPNRKASPAEVLRARMQFNGGEDPATGSAAGCAISYLVARAQCPRERIHLRQGVEIGRPSDFISPRAMERRG